MVLREEPDLEKILSRSVLLGGDDVRFEEADESQCHVNAAMLHLTRPAERRIMTGYALSADGMWRQHSWIYEGSSDVIVETTERRVGYYGAVLDDVESLTFWMANVPYSADAEALVSNHPAFPAWSRSRASRPFESGQEYSNAMDTAEAQERNAYDLRNTGDIEGALGAYQRAAEAFEGEGDTLGEAHAVRHVGDILRGLARYREADRHYERALALYNAREDRLDLDLANALRGYALSLEAQGKDATPLWQRAHALYRAAGVEAGVAESRASARPLGSRAAAPGEASVGLAFENRRDPI